MVRWLRWHCPPDTGFEIRALAVWGRARYLSVTEAPHNTNFHTWMGKKQFCFFQTAETGNRTPDSGVKGSGANHYPRDQQHQFVFQQDNAPCHRSMAMLAWLENNDNRKILFPPQSQDVNLIKNIWSCMKKDAWEVKPTTRKEIKTALFRCSDRIRPAKIRAVFSSLLRRAAAIIRSQDQN